MEGVKASATNVPPLLSPFPPPDSMFRDSFVAPMPDHAEPQPTDATR